MSAFTPKGSAGPPATRYVPEVRRYFTALLTGGSLSPLGWMGRRVGDWVQGGKPPCGASAGSENFALSGFSVCALNSPSPPVHPISPQVWFLGVAGSAWGCSDLSYGPLLYEGVAQKGWTPAAASPYRKKRTPSTPCDVRLGGRATGWPPRGWMCMSLRIGQHRLQSVFHGPLNTSPLEGLSCIVL